MSNHKQRADTLIASRVDAGIRVMFAKFGADWPKRIDLHTFTIGDGAVCAIAQLTGKGYEDGCRQIGISPGGRKARSIGIFPYSRFDSLGTPDRHRWNLEIGQLDHEWACRIRELHTG